MIINHLNGTTNYEFAPCLRQWHADWLYIFGARIRSCTSGTTMKWFKDWTSLNLNLFFLLFTFSLVHLIQRVTALKSKNVSRKSQDHLDTLNVVKVQRYGGNTMGRWVAAWFEMRYPTQMTQLQTGDSRTEKVRLSFNNSTHWKALFPEIGCLNLAL